MTVKIKLIKKTCKNCTKPFEAQRSTAKFCSNKCRQANLNGKSSKTIKIKSAKKMQACSYTGCFAVRVHKGAKSYTCKSCRGKLALDNALGRFRRSTIGLNIQGCMKRSGTIETFKDIGDLDYYTKLTRLRRRYESSNKASDFHIMHLVASDSEVVCLSSKANLFIGDAKRNLSSGNKAIFKGAIEGKHYLKRSDLNSSLLVSTPSEQANLWNRFVEHFGEKELSKWAKGVGFSPRSKQAYEPPRKDKESLFEVAFSQLLDSDIEVSLYFDLAVAWSDYVSYMRTRFESKIDYTGDYASGVEIIEIGEAVQNAIISNDGELIKTAIELINKLEVNVTNTDNLEDRGDPCF